MQAALLFLCTIKVQEPIGTAAPFSIQGDVGMNKKKISRLLEPRIRLYFFFLLAFAVVTVFFDYTIAAVEGAVILGLYLYFYITDIHRQRQILQYIETVTCDVDTATKDTVLNAPLPMVIFKPETEEVIWSNERFLQISGEREHMFDTKITDAVPTFSSRWLMEGKTECPELVSLSGRKYLVFGHLVRTDPNQPSGGLLATIYWVDVTDFASVKAEYFASRPAAAIIVLDNYEEITKNLSDNAKSALVAQIDDKVGEWAAPARGILSKYDRDRYLFVFESRFLPAFQEHKFSILDSVRTIISTTGIAASVSIGIGKDGETLQDLFQYAALSIDMALSRGGDQVVLKNRFQFEFFGGRAKELEKRTKVKSRVMANALNRLLDDTSYLFIMGHSMPDLDCIGAAAGLCAIARKKETRAYIVLEQNGNLAAGMTARLAALPEYEDVFLSPQEALLRVDNRSLLILVDTNRPEQVISRDFLAACNRVAVIDHHRRAATYVADAVLNFHEPFASSTCELVAELLQYLVEPKEILHLEADALLSGIVLDTKSFSIRTGSRTFEAAAFLRQAGADPVEVKKQFQNDLAGTISRYDVIQNAQLYHKTIAISAVDRPVGRIIAAQAADELLNISGVETSFVLYSAQDSVFISARSIGSVNVQLIMEALGGGGNGATAGAQLKGQSLSQVVSDLKTAIDQYLKDA
jgi:c-di-AMP phosphodiesterase-like protein